MNPAEVARRAEKRACSALVFELPATGEFLAEDRFSPFTLWVISATAAAARLKLFERIVEYYLRKGGRR